MHAELRSAVWGASEQVCNLCSKPLGKDDVLRLPCFHMMHAACVIGYAASKPDTTTPAGYGCPQCSTSIVPGLGDNSAIAQGLREALSREGWFERVGRVLKTQQDYVDARLTDGAPSPAARAGVRERTPATPARADPVVIDMSGEVGAAAGAAATTAALAGDDGGGKYRKRGSALASLPGYASLAQLNASYGDVQVLCMNLRSWAIGLALLCGFIVFIVVGVAVRESASGSRARAPRPGVLP